MYLFCTTRFQIKNPPKLKDVKRLLVDLFSLPTQPEASFQYIDDDDDVITVSSDTELEEAFEVYRGLGKTLRFFAVIPNNASKISKPTSTYSEVTSAAPTTVSVGAAAASPKVTTPITCYII